MLYPPTPIAIYIGIGIDIAACMCPKLCVNVCSH